MMNISDDTVIFGVPVDADDIGAATAVGMHISTAPQAEEHIQPIEDKAHDDDAAVKPKRIRKKKEDAISADAEVEHTEKPAAPILSVLGVLKPENAQSISTPAPAAETTITVTEEITIEAKIEKPATIEDIFAELEPLKEDKIVDLASHSADAAASQDDIETDETLSKMAAEFAAAQKDIPDAPAQKGGKIGKLKNILPFKKAKKEDQSLLGDLFGWAGIAANDDDERFALPDFFRASN